MKHLIVLISLAFFASLIPSHAEDLDTVWTHNLEQYNTNSNCARFMPDGKSIIAGVGNTLYEFETASGKLIRKFRADTLTSNVDILEISPNGEYIVTGFYSGNLFYWDYKTGKFIKRINDNGSIKHVTGICFTPDASKLFICSIDSLFIYNNFTNKIENTIYFPIGWINRAIVSKDGNYFALDNTYTNSSTKIRYSRLQLWDAKHLTMIKELDEITRDVRSIAFSPSSKYVTFTTIQNEEAFLRIYNLVDNTKELYPSGFLGYQPWGVVPLKGDSSLIITGGNDYSDRRAKLINIKTGNSSYYIKHGAVQSNLDINANDQILFNELSNLILINSRWLTTDVQQTGEKKSNTSIQLKYMNNSIILTNNDNEIIKFIKIFDIQGKLVQSFFDSIPSQTNLLINLPFTSPTGVYFCRVVTSDNDYSFKFIVEPK